MIQFEGQRVFLIPDDSRDAYFELIDEISEKIPRLFNLREKFIEVYSDPIIIIDFSLLSERNVKILERRLENIKAKEITETLI